MKGVTLSSTTKRGPEKIWTRERILNAGIDHIEKYGELPSHVAWKYGTEDHPTAGTASSAYRKDGSKQTGWQIYLATLRREYRKRTGNEAPKPRKGRRPGIANGESVYDGRDLGPGKSVFGDRYKSGKNAAKYETPAPPVVINIPDVEVPQVPVSKPTTPERGFWSKFKGFLTGE